MKRVTIRTANRETSTVVCAKHVFRERLAPMREKLLSGGGMIFTDSNVFEIYKKKIARYLGGVPVFAMPAGESNKTQETLFSLLEAMVGAGLRRNSVLIALGGGVVGDIGGLAAALYMRGISCIQVPTTLLAQVDSSVGGKTAIDFYGVKNLIGAFKQPDVVYADPAFFATLPAREIRCGLGEIVKHAALDGALFDTLCAGRDALFDLGFLAKIVPSNIAFKAKIVRRDARESGLRKCLNLGHTTGHALELFDGKLSHGEYVLLGIIYEAEIAARRCGGDRDYLDALIALCRSILVVDPAEIDAAKAASLAAFDKKNEQAGEVSLVVPVRKGEYALFKMAQKEYERELNAIREKL